jgi:hypothetical protein
MTGLTQCITETVWVDLMTIWYVLVDDAYWQLEMRYGKWRKRGPEPQFSDSEVITVALLCDLVFAGHEARTLHYLRQHHADLFPRLPSNGRFNERRIRLAGLIEQLRQELSRTYGLVPDSDPVRLIDSAPISLCTYQRGGECETVAQATGESGLTIKDYVGYSAKAKAYFVGCRLHLSITLDLNIDSWTLVPGSCHDSVAMEDLVADATNRRFLADNAYRAPKITELWCSEHNTIVLAPPRSNSRTPWPEETRQFFGRIRRRIESVFSVLATTFHLERPGSRSWLGCLCRTTTQLLGYTLCCITDKLMNTNLLPQTQN